MLSLHRSTGLTLISLSLVIGAGRLAAQARRGEVKSREIPASAMPPEGMCRLWIAGVAESQQPAPTDCATAIRNRTRNATVLFGDLRGYTLPPNRPARPGEWPIRSSEALMRPGENDGRAEATRRAAEAERRNDPRLHAPESAVGARSPATSPPVIRPPNPEVTPPQAKPKPPEKPQ